MKNELKTKILEVVEKYRLIAAVFIVFGVSVFYKYYTDSTVEETIESLYPEIAGALIIYIILYFENSIFKKKELESLLESQNLISSSNDQKQVEYDDFLKSIEFSKISNIEVICHTGHRTVNSLLKYIEDNRNLEIEVKILLRDPSVEKKIRSESIRLTEQQIEKLNKNIIIRHYQSIPIFRLVNIYRKNGVLDSYFLGFYEFDDEGISKAVPERENIDKNALMQKLATNWFTYFWGRTKLNKKYHTLIFDFDDTITKSHIVQIDAWAFAIRESIKTKVISQNDFIDEISQSLTNETQLKQIISKIFFENQSVPEILAYILQNKDLNESQKSKISELRKQFRIDKFAEMKDELLFDNVYQVLSKLREDYFLIIISLTDEKIIENFLKHYSKPNKNGKHVSLFSFFQYVWGSQENKLGIKNLKNKSQLFLKLGIITGIPFDRMIFVGDSQDDFNSSCELDIKFVEARLFGDKVKKFTMSSSLIKEANVTTNKIPFFTDWKELPTIINKIENE